MWPRERQHPENITDSVVGFENSNKNANPLEITEESIWEDYDSEGNKSQVFVPVLRLAGLAFEPYTDWQVFPRGATAEEYERISQRERDCTIIESGGWYVEPIEKVIARRQWGDSYIRKWREGSIRRVMELVDTTEEVVLAELCDAADLKRKIELNVKDIQTGGLQLNDDEKDAIREAEERFAIALETFLEPIRMADLQDARDRRTRQEEILRRKEAEAEAARAASAEHQKSLALQAGVARHALRDLLDLPEN